SSCVFQAEDGIRDFHVTGVQTCALPISSTPCFRSMRFHAASTPGAWQESVVPGRAELRAAGGVDIRLFRSAVPAPAQGSPSADRDRKSVVQGNRVALSSRESTGRGIGA